MKLGLRPDEAADVVGSKEIFERMRLAKWVAPVVQGKRLTLYNSGDIARAWARLCRGEHLPVTKRAREAKG